jgi:HSP20 family protein
MFDLRPYRRNGNVAAYGPFRSMDEYEKLFTDPFRWFGEKPLPEFKADISDQGDSFLLEADLPGVAKEDIKLDVNGDVLTVSAERHSEREEKDKAGKYVCCERSYGAYTRRFDISGIRSEDIKAKYENGVLKLTLPKKENALPAALKSSKPQKIQLCFPLENPGARKRPGILPLE